MKLKGTVAHIYDPAYRFYGNFVRLGFTSQFMTPPDERFGQITLNPTWQMFPHASQGVAKGDMDGYLRTLKDRNVKVMAACWNGFNKKFNTPLKSLPMDGVGLDKTNPDSYKVYQSILEEMVTRWGSTGQNTIWGMQLLNEINLYPGNPHPEETLTGAQYAVLLDYWRNAIRAIDPDMIIVTAPTARFDRVWLDSFWNKWDGDLGNDFENMFISINIYPFGGCGVWGTCDAKKPEETQPLRTEVNTWLKERNLQGIISEHGCNSEKLSDLGYPQYDGLGKNESQAKLIIDYTNAWLAESNIYAITAYQLKDSTEHRFAKTGTCFADSASDPTPKPSYHIVKANFEQPTTDKIPVEIDVIGDTSKLEITFET